MVCLGIVALLAAAPGTKISPSDAKVHLIGRFDRRVATAPKCSWPGTGVELRLKGESLDIAVDESGEDFWQVEVNGRPTETLALAKGTSTAHILIGSPDKAVTVRLIKRTEAFVGFTTFKSFATDGSFSAPTPPKRFIQVVGDSITCGYGNEGANQNEHFRAGTENAYQAYGSIAARALKAEVSLISWSGRKMWPDNTVPEIYDLTVPTDSSSTYNFADPAPSAIVINLATNDFGQGNPEEKGWTGAYESFIGRLRKHYPKAVIYPAMGSMMSDNYPAGNKALSTLRSYLTRMISRLGDPKVKLLEMDPQKMEDGIGSDWHPNVVTHQKMAAKVVAAIRHDLGW